jgi:hypothetical protein
MIIASLLAVIELQAGFLGGYAYASFLESYFHEHINDASKQRVDRWRRRSWLFQPLIRINFTHHIVHHAKTYRSDHVTQFQSVAEKAALDGELNKTVHGRRAIEGHYGLTFLPLRRAVTALPLVPAVMLCYFLFGTWATLGAAAAVSLPAFLANRVHPYLHMPYERAHPRGFQAHLVAPAHPLHASGHTPSLPPSPLRSIQLQLAARRGLDSGQSPQGRRRRHRRNAAHWTPSAGRTHRGATHDIDCSKSTGCCSRPCASAINNRDVMTGTPMGVRASMASA